MTNISMKLFLSHIDTKQDLTVFLTNKVIEKLSSMNIPYVVTYDTKSLTNISDLKIDMHDHDHEEADTLIILHATKVGLRLPFSKSIIYSPDTDVFLLLIYYYKSLPMITVFFK